MKYLYSLILLLLVSCSQNEKNYELNVSSEPKYSSVYINDKYIGTTPLENYVIEKGVYDLRVSHTDFYDYTEKLIFSDEISPITISSDLIKHKAYINFSQFPSGLDIQVIYNDKDSTQEGYKTPHTKVPVELGDAEIELLYNGSVVYREKIRSKTKDDINILNISKNIRFSSFDDYYYNESPNNLQYYISSFRPYNSEFLNLLISSNDIPNINDYIQLFDDMNLLKLEIIKLISLSITKQNIDVSNFLIEKYIELEFDISSLGFLNSELTQNYTDFLIERGLEKYSINDNKFLNDLDDNSDSSINTFLYTITNTESHRDKENDYFLYDSTSEITKNIKTSEYSFIECSPDSTKLLFRKNEEFVIVSDNKIKTKPLPQLLNDTYLTDIFIDNSENIYFTIWDGSLQNIQMISNDNQNHSIINKFSDNITYNHFFTNNGTEIVGQSKTEDKNTIHIYNIETKEVRNIDFPFSDGFLVDILNNILVFSLKNGIFLYYQLEDNNYEFLFSNYYYIEYNYDYTKFTYTIFNDANFESTFYYFNRMDSTRKEIFKTDKEESANNLGWIDDEVIDDMILLLNP